MAKHRRKIKRVTPQRVALLLDATPERLAKGDQFDWVRPDGVDGCQRGINPTVRRFRMSHLDRLHNAGKLTQVQVYAGDWYRNTHHKCAFGAKVTGSYGERTTGGMQEAGLPRTEAQWRARQDFRQAREQWPQAMREHMDRFLLDDVYPKLSHRARDRDLGQMRNALDRLAMYLRLC